MDEQSWNERYRSAEPVWGVEPNRFVREELERVPLSPGRALDWACGEGRNAIWLASKGWTVTGVDFSSAGLDTARRLADGAGVSVEWVQADVTRHRLEPGSVDLVVICYLQLAADARRDALERAVEAVEPGGTLLYVAHDLSNLESGYGGPGSAEVLPTPDEVVEQLPGWSIDRAEVVQRPVETDHGPRVALDTLVRAVAPGE